MSRFRRPKRQLVGKRWPAIIPVSLGLAIASLVFFSWLADEILRKRTDRFDDTVRSVIHDFASPALTDLMRFVTNLGDWQVIFTATLCLLFYLWYRRNNTHILITLVAMTGAGILDGSLKLAFHRARPDPFFIAKPSTYSFPSGHALISLCFYGLLAGTLTHDLRSKWQRGLVWTAAALFITLIGLSRVYLGVHWPSDVLAGYAAALIWMGAVRVMALRLEAKQERAAARNA
jgi:membrane-associated phospholipid phosphatase